MDRHTLQQIDDKVRELLRFGSPSCIRQANSIMLENFNTIVYFALGLSETKPTPKHTIADNYPAGGLTATEPCTFCENYEKLEDANAALEAENKKLREALMEAIATIRTWHGSPGWEIYKTSSPEMKQIFEALKKT